MELISNAINNFVVEFKNFFWFFWQLWNILESIASFILSVCWFFWYAWKSLVIWIYKLLYYVFDWSVFVNVNRVLVQISDYIWWPATVFLSCMLILVIIRIIVAFVFKIFRRNLDYHSMQKANKRISLEDAIEDMKWRWFFSD